MPTSCTPPEDALLLSILDEHLVLAARLAGDHLACRAGCTPCCIGPFPITRLDAARLRDGLRWLESEDPSQAARVLGRARDSAAILRGDFPGDPSSGILGDDEDAEEAFLARHAALPCPALDPGTGMCELYAHRPVSCRTFGPPVRLGDEDLPPCRLCFVGAPEEEITRCRVEPDPDGIEDAILDRMDGGDAQTLIAFALASVDAGGQSRRWRGRSSGAR